MSKFAFRKKVAFAFVSEYNTVMSVKVRPRRTLPRAERQLRSKLNQLLDCKGVIRGTLAERARTCGKEGCKCVTKGEKHVSLYLVVREEGSYRQVYVPRSLESVVRQWVENYKKAKDLLEEISRLHYEKLRSREI